MNALKSFCHVLSCSLELPSYTYTCLLIIGGKVGLALQVAVHITLRATPTRFPNLILSTHSTHCTDHVLSSTCQGLIQGGGGAVDMVASPLPPLILILISDSETIHNCHPTGKCSFRFNMISFFGCVNIVVF